MGCTYRDRVPVQVRADLPQVQQLCLGQEAGFSPDGIQDGRCVALQGMDGGGMGQMRSCSRHAPKPGAWPNRTYWPGYPFQERKQVKATFPPFIPLQPKAPTAKAEQALGQVQGERSCEARGQNPSRQPAALIPGFWRVSGPGQTSKLSCLPQETRGHGARPGYRWISGFHGIVCGYGSQAGRRGEVVSAPHPKPYCRASPLLRERAWPGYWHSRDACRKPQSYTPDLDSSPACQHQTWLEHPDHLHYPLLIRLFIP